MEPMGDDAIAENTHHHRNSSSSSDSSDDAAAAAHVLNLKHKIYRLFGREKPIHKLLGGGKRTWCLNIIHNIIHSIVDFACM